MREAEREALARLLADGFVRQEEERCVPAPRWHAALMRAALALQARGEELEDLRVPVAWALHEVYGESSSAAQLVALVTVMAPLSGLRAR